MTGAKELIPGYQILDKVGEGGMGAVYRAVQLKEAREVALKILPKRLARQSAYRERFFQESEMAMGLSHPNIIEALDAGEANGFCFLAMEFVDGQSMLDWFHGRKSFSADEILGVIEQAAAGLAHAWGTGLVHRDVKPENFLITEDGTVKLCDMGLAKVQGETVNEQGEHVVGTPLYMAPEQAEASSRVDFRADMYSLGVVLYYFLSGKHPFRSDDNSDLLRKHIRETPIALARRVPQLPGSVTDLAKTMLAKKPEERYPSAEALVSAISEARRDAGESPVTVPVAAGDKPQASSRELRAMQLQLDEGRMGKIVLLLILVGLILALVWSLCG